MKKIIITLALILSSSLYCQYKDYKVDFKDSRGSFSFMVKTVEDRSTTGELVINNLQISIPVDNVPGTIVMELVLNPAQVHLPAFGQQAGKFTFYKGKLLPQIMEGRYEVVIDGISYGHMDVDQKQRAYYPLEKSLH